MGWEKCGKPQWNILQKLMADVAVMMNMNLCTNEADYQQTSLTW